MPEPTFPQPWILTEAEYLSLDPRVRQWLRPYLRVRMDQAAYNVVGVDHDHFVTTIVHSLTPTPPSEIDRRSTAAALQQASALERVFAALTAEPPPPPSPLPPEPPPPSDTGPGLSFTVSSTPPTSSAREAYDRWMRDMWMSDRWIDRSTIPTTPVQWTSSGGGLERSRDRRVTLIEDEQRQEESRMSMTRSDFTRIADVLARAKPDPESGTVGEKRVWAKIVKDMIEQLSGYYSNFDVPRFRERSGFTEPEEGGEVPARPRARPPQPREELPVDDTGENEDED